jgi:lipopolysaccharide export system protein LptC
MAAVSRRWPPAGAAPRLRRTRDRLSRVWERTAIYIPVLLMGLLALGTYWLVRNTPDALPAEGQRAASSEPDYYMRKFGIKTFDEAGQLKSDVTGIEVRHYPATDTLEIDKALIRSYSIEGRLTTSTGDRALTNGDGSEVQLIGNARVVRDASVGPDGREAPRLEFRGEFLHAYLLTERLRSHLPVQIRRGASELRAGGMEYDHLTRTVQLKGPVRAVFVPPGKGGQGQG